MKSRYQILLLSLFCLVNTLIGCASFQTVPTTELGSRHLVGHWESEDGYINIYCNGAISTKLSGDEILAGDKNLGAQSQVTSGLHIKSISNKGLVIGSFWSSAKDEYSVQRWPYMTEKGLEMRMLNMQWTRTSTDSCK